MSSCRWKKSKTTTWDVSNLANNVLRLPTNWRRISSINSPSIFFWFLSQTLGVFFVATTAFRRRRHPQHLDANWACSARATVQMRRLAKAASGKQRKNMWRSRWFLFPHIILPHDFLFFECWNCNVKFVGFSFNYDTVYVQYICVQYALWTYLCHLFLATSQYVYDIFQWGLHSMLNKHPYQQRRLHPRQSLHPQEIHKPWVFNHP